MDNFKINPDSKLIILLNAAGVVAAYVLLSISLYNPRMCRFPPRVSGGSAC